MQRRAVTGSQALLPDPCTPLASLLRLLGLSSPSLSVQGGSQGLAESLQQGIWSASGE